MNVTTVDAIGNDTHSGSGEWQYVDQARRCFDNLWHTPGRTDAP